MDLVDIIKFKTVLRKMIALKANTEGAPVALLFSGGTDSLTVLWTLMDLGIPVNAYTFHLSHHKSQDLIFAEKACGHWNIPLTIVTENNNTKKEIEDMIGVIQSARKTHVECMFAFWRMIQNVKEKQVFSGILADVLYGSDRDSCIQHSKSIASVFTEYRLKYLREPDTDGVKQAGMICDHFKKQFIAPYTEPELWNTFFGWTLKEMNSPKQKMPALLAFQDRFNEIKIYRKNENLQCESGIREYMESVFGLHVRKSYKEILNSVNNGGFQDGLPTF